MPCERIDPRDFHSPAANQYTLNCLEELAHSATFKSYVRHVEYKERFYLTWFLAPFALFGILYYHLAMFGEEGIGLFMEPSMRSSVPLSVLPTGMVSAIVLLLLFVIPCIVIAPFVGFFEEPRRWHSVVTLAFLTLVNIAIASFGGSRLHYPPFVTTVPPVTELIVSWHPADVAVILLRDIFVRRCLCLQGFLLAGYTVAFWRSRFWGRVWHPPLPLVTIPVAVGLAGIVWWMVVQKSIPLFLRADGSPTPVAEALHWSAVQSDPAGAAGLCLTVAKEIYRQVLRDVAPSWQQRQLPLVLQDPHSCVSLFLATVSMALVHIFILLAKPVVDFVLGAFLFALPTDPTLWGLTLVGTVGSAVALWRVNDGLTYMPHIAGLCAVAFSLLWNGFLA
ncbi:hypothetical protein LSCM1_04373 [Leishmania martiniquensis]|uniref:Uncharacterized protein n=1 Tax=Leishmania martiniquensis TaxID=1580590 RepID=A0A836HBN8_9TRYP|nr:hypothetical protein LSCM1_04373 [Leishmania martiniquensis]